MSDATSLVYSYSALFGLSILAATVVPMSSEPPLIYLVATEQHVVLPVLVGTVGNVLGACTTYWISRRAAQALAEKRSPRGDTPGRLGCSGATGSRRCCSPGCRYSAMRWSPSPGLQGCTSAPFASGCPSVKASATSRSRSPP